MEELYNCKSYYEICYPKAQQEITSEEITNNNIELLTDNLRELKAHEEEIRKVRQELETQLQRYKMKKLIALELR
jgi:hypothetical protein